MSACVQIKKVHHCHNASYYKAIWLNDAVGELTKGDLALENGDELPALELDADPALGGQPRNVPADMLGAMARAPAQGSGVRRVCDAFV